MQNLKHLTRLNAVMKKWDRESNKPENKQRYDLLVDDPVIWQHILECLDEDRPIYCFAKTQSGKTAFKQALAKKLLTFKVKDVVIISTTNLTTAMEQMRGRIASNLSPQRINVIDSTNMPARFNPGNVVITMTNSSRISALHDMILKTQQYDEQGNFEPLSYALIVDEGDEYEPAAGGEDGSKPTESILYELFAGLRNEHNIDVDLVKVSATLAGALYTSGYWAGLYGDLKPKQLIELPTSNDYIGIGHGLHFDTNLIEEPKHIFNGTSLSEDVQTANESKNFCYIVQQIENLIEIDNEFGLVQIGNIVYGTSTKSHEVIAKVLSAEFENTYGRSVAIWDSMSHLSDFSRTTEVLFIVHNGTTKGYSLQEKLLHCADYFKNLKAILIVADKMANKSITIEAVTDNSNFKDIYDVNNKAFGYWCNFTVVYGSKERSVGAEIQYLRCTGNRPALKKHIVFCTDYVSKNIHAYYEDIESNITDIKNSGGWDKTKLIERTMSYRKKIDKAVVDKRLSRVSAGKSRRKATIITLSERDEFVKQGYVERDLFAKLTDTEFNKVKNDKQQAIQLAQKFGFGKNTLETPLKVVFNKPTLINNINDSHRAKMKTGDTDADWVISVFEYNSKKWIYCYNNMDLIPANANQVEYHIQSKNNQLEISQAQLYAYGKSTQGTIYKVKK